MTPTLNRLRSVAAPVASSRTVLLVLLLWLLLLVGLCLLNVTVAATYDTPPDGFEPLLGMGGLVLVLGLLWLINQL